MIMYFSGKCKGKNTSHTKISNSQSKNIQKKLNFLIKIKYLFLKASFHFKIVLTLNIKYKN